MAFSAHVASWHVARLRPNIFIILQSGKHTFSVLLQVNISSFHHVVPSNVKPCNRFQFSHSSSPPAITASHFVDSLVQQLYAKEVYFCSFVTIPTIQSSMHQILTHMSLKVSIGPSYMESVTRFSQAPSLGASPTFHHRTSPFCWLPIISSLELSRKIVKQIYNLPSRVTILDCCARALTCYPLGH